LLVAEKLPDGSWKTLHETSTVTGLGKGTKHSGLIGHEGWGSTLAALKTAFATAEKFNAESVTAAGTMALRIAINASDFLQAAQNQSTPVNVISGDLEAELGFLAVAQDPLFANSNRISIIDPG